MRAYHHIREGSSLPNIRVNSPFRTVLVINQPCSWEWQSEVCKWLVDNGCVYVMVWGEACVDWHDEIDLANIKKFEPDRVPDDHHIITTWHEDEPLEEVFWFAKVCADHPEVEILLTLLIHISDEGDKDEMLARFDVVREL